MAVHNHYKRIEHEMEARRRRAAEEAAQQAAAGGAAGAGAMDLPLRSPSSDLETMTHLSMGRADLSGVSNFSPLGCISSVTGASGAPSAGATAPALSCFHRI